ncbi:GTPase obg [Zostera marina]|uniref:GTPase obg n=1 Tax=Zostera marina TaxID=29655 RepID=A0A0K9NUA9_ZOSMR|nr:GTPase obg [Zostera marina]
MNTYKTFHFLQQWRLIPSSSTASATSTICFTSPITTSHFQKGKPSAVFFCREMQSGTGQGIAKSFKPRSFNAQELQDLEKSAMVLEKTGAFQKLPMVMPSIDILSSAKRKAKRVPPSKGISNIAKRSRNQGAKQLDALMKELMVPLKGYMENFPKRRFLHPYERSLIELTLGEGIYEEVLASVNSLRKKISFTGKQHASLCAQSLTKREAEDRLSEGISKLEQLFELHGKAIDDLVRIAKALRAMPVVNPAKPTLCLVGAPNVGKSSLVRVLSTGKPEICNYPFTTRGILMGHISFGYGHFQVTDTPGLLTRKDEERNNLEKLTLAVLSHLPTAVLFVHDLTGECGTSVCNQFITYKDIKERFKDHLWIDVVSKCDLLEEAQINNSKEEVESYKRSGPNGALLVSVKSEKGLNELKVRVHDLLISQMGRIKSEMVEEEAM